MKLGRTAMAMTLMLTPLTAAPSPAAGTAAVGIKEFKYAPTALSIPLGTTVRWTNHDEEPHTVTSAQGVFGSTGLSHEETFTQMFTRRGTYEYFCALHPQMRATVVVK